MKLNKLLIGLGSLAIAGYALSFSGKGHFNSKSLEEKIAKSDTLEIFESKPIRLLSKRDSLNLLDFVYNFNEKDLFKYNSWIDSTIKESKINNSYAIIVNKADYRLFLYKDGKKQMEFPVELGRNPYDDKNMEGDMSTPEGMYKIKEKFADESNYHKAFVINYPDSADFKEFCELKKKKLIPQNAKIGGEIEIHGRGTGYAGGSGYDNDSRAILGKNWTLGCVALSNERIDKIFDLVPRGTRATIVKYTDRKL